MCQTSEQQWNMKNRWKKDKIKSQFRSKNQIVGNYFYKKKEERRETREEKISDKIAKENFLEWKRHWIPWSKRATEFLTQQMKLDNGTGIKGKFLPVSRKKSKLQSWRDEHGFQLLSATLEARRYYSKAFQIMKESDLRPGIVYPVKLSIRYKLSIMQEDGK